LTISGQRCLGQKTPMSRGKAHVVGCSTSGVRLRDSAGFERF
jgi:hypothetical protein